MFCAEKSNKALRLPGEFNAVFGKNVLLFYSSVNYLTKKEYYELCVSKFHPV